MLVPGFVALASVALGTALGLLRRERGVLVRALQWAAIATAVLVALVDLLPEAIEAAGAWTLAAFALPLLLPMLSQRALGELLSREGAPVLELGYAALLVHRLVDGLVLGLYGGAAGAIRPPILLAIGAHEVPISAAVALRFAQRDGTRAALLRAVGLGASSLLGVFLTGQAPDLLIAQVDPWAKAIISGLLVHIAQHEWRVRHLEPQAAGAAWSR
jgi:zinc transporter ZupT